MQHSQDDNDTNLLDRISIKRDRQAMESFYLSYRPRLGGFLYRILKNRVLVEEVYNDVMMVVWNKANQFNGTCKVSTWLFSIAYRTCLKRLKKESRFKDCLEIEELAVSDTFEVTDNQQVIRKALQKLSFEHRTVIELAYFVGNNYAEIAEITNAPENTVKTRMFYARKNLQQALNFLGVNSVVNSSEN